MLFRFYRNLIILFRDIHEIDYTLFLLSAWSISAFLLFTALLEDLLDKERQHNLVESIMKACDPLGALRPASCKHLE